MNNLCPWWEQWEYLNYKTTNVSIWKYDKDFIIHWMLKQILVEENLYRISLSITNVFQNMFNS